MTELRKWRQKIQRYIDNGQDFNESELKEAVHAMAEVTSKNIERCINANERAVKQNEELAGQLEEEKLYNDMAFNFIKAKGLEKEFEFYVGCQVDKILQ